MGWVRRRRSVVRVQECWRCDRVQHQSKNEAPGMKIYPIAMWRQQRCRRARRVVTTVDICEGSPVRDRSFASKQPGRGSESRVSRRRTMVRVAAKRRYSLPMRSCTHGRMLWQARASESGTPQCCRTTAARYRSPTNGTEAHSRTARGPSVGGSHCTCLAFSQKQ